jgi:hypothetical protein
MRRFLLLLFIATPLSIASAETPSANKPADTKDSQHSTGKTELNDKGQLQPQGWTGPITTGTSGGAPAESPQGQTPPGMQAAPGGSSKTITGPK